MDRLGKYKTGKSCLYVKRLSDVDPSVLEELVALSIAHIRETHETATAESRKSAQTRGDPFPQ